jgi:hypothetical protein
LIFRHLEYKGLNGPNEAQPLHALLRALAKVSRSPPSDVLYIDTQALSHALPRFARNEISSIYSTFD